MNPLINADIGMLYTTVSRFLAKIKYTRNPASYTFIFSSLPESPLPKQVYLMPGEAPNDYTSFLCTTTGVFNEFYVPQTDRTWYLTETETLDLPAEKVADTLRVSGRHISVDAPFVEGEDNSLLDVLVNDDSPVADKTLINESLSTEVERALATLTERERDIIRLFFGINCQEMTLEEIGEKFGLTRERVRQIKEKAIRRLRHSSRSKLLKTYLG